jgi:hypothetical protein
MNLSMADLRNYWTEFLETWWSYRYMLNYRPVSLLSCVSKILEKIVYKQIYNHLHINKLLYKFQSGFLPGYSTTHQWPIQVSSANSLPMPVILSATSFIKIRKSNGPKTDPWGTPAFNSPVLDIAMCYLTLSIFHYLLCICINI